MRSCHVHLSSSVTPILLDVCVASFRRLRLKTQINSAFLWLFVTVVSICFVLFWMIGAAAGATPSGAGAASAHGIAALPTGLSG